LHSPRQRIDALFDVQTNLQDASKRTAASERKAAIEPTPASSAPAETQSSQYRDRAAERRIALGQPDQPVIESFNPRKRARPEPEPIVQPNREGLAEDNRGRKLLEASGWNQGEGLGQGQGGRAGIVEARQYAPGAGLGASQGKHGDLPLTSINSVQVLLSEAPIAGLIQPRTDVRAEKQLVSPTDMQHRRAGQS
jgi:hypothetical protein